MSDPVPELVPARMLNEFVYCPRLFYLEWNQRQFEHNADTAEGRWRHRAVDTPRGEVPEPGDAWVRKATSVEVGSRELGAIAVIDVLEGDGTEVRPVDVKKGVPPAHGPVWEPELIQLGLQGLLLRANGYTCREGAIYFAAANERRVVPLDESLISRTLTALGRLREVAAATHPPPPLIDSPKCPRCSLVGICLPDEVNVLAVRTQRPPRRLIPREVSARPMYVTEHGVTLGVSGGRIQVSRQREVLAETRMIDVSQLNVYANAQVTTQLLRECFARDIPVCWFSYGGWFQGVAVGLPKKNIELRRRQFGLAAQEQLSIAARIVEGKIRNCRILLRRNQRIDDDVTFARLKELAARAKQATSVESLLGIEGAAARTYFSRFESMLKPGLPFEWPGRNRRPPTDPVNCMLSYLYSLLIKDLTAVVHGVGFDPYLGVYHKPRFGRPALSLDLAEEFRPLICDSTTINLINNGEVHLADFVCRARGVSLQAPGKRAVMRAYERRLETEVTHPLFGYRVTYRRLLEVQARLLAAHMCGEV